MCRVEGNNHFRKGKFNAAIDAYTNALLIEPSSILYSNRALCHRKLGNAEGMHRDASKAVSMDKHNPKGCYLLGLALQVCRCAPCTSHLICRSAHAPFL